MHHLTFDPRERVFITLLGVGGTGSLLLTHLVRIDQMLTQLGGHGLHVRAFDDDLVSVTNLTRQNFAPSDVGRPKSVVLVERCNLYAGLAWQAFPRRTTASDFRQQTHHIVITCVDSGASRRLIAEQLLGSSPHYWLDCGNESHTGQVILGQVRNTSGRLQHILDRDPTGMQGKDDHRPSCSAAEALTRQSPFINQHVALAAADLLGTLLLTSVTPSCGTFINLEGAVRTVTMPVPDDQPKPSRNKKYKPLLPKPRRSTSSSRSRISGQAKRAR